MSLVCLVILGMLQVLLVKTAFSARQVSREQAWRHQARWLAEAGVERAASRLAGDATYRGETWELPAGELYVAGDRQSEPASVEIEVQAADVATAQRMVLIRAAYPRELPRRVVYEKRITISLTSAR
jgi:hypothetical protein